MAKRKDSIALFEVISKSRDKSSQAADFHVPGWMDPQAAPDDQASPGDRPGAPAPVEAEMISTVGGRLTLSLNYVSCVAIALALVLLWAIGFWLGRWSAGQPAPAAPPTEMVEADGGAEQVSDNPLAGLTWNKGKYCLVIQELAGGEPKHEQDAWVIMRYLADQGVPAYVVSYQGRYRVLSLEGVDATTGDQADGFRASIERLGLQYSQAGNDYDFKGAYYWKYPEKLKELKSQAR